MRKNLNWEELLSNPPYSLKIKRKDNLILFNYSQIKSDPSKEIVKEARGTIIEDKTFKPICLGFKRFYNIDEPYSAKIDWNTAVATSKEDGTLFFIYWYNGEWHVKTRSTFDAEEAPMDSVKFANFKKLFDYLISFYPNFSYDKLNKNYVYCLEGCSDFNRIVIEYNTPCLFHLTTRDMSTLQEIDTEIGIPKPKMYNLNNEEDYRQLVANMSEGHEGIVVCDANYNRVKIKTESYVKAHRLSNNNTMTLAIAVGLIRSNEQNEFLSYFPVYKDYFAEVQNKINAAIRKIDDINNETAAQKEKLNQLYSVKNAKKQFALSIKDNPLKNLYFLAWDEKLTHKWIESLTDACFIKNLRLEN